jgi:hypothetical protein
MSTIGGCNTQNILLGVATLNELRSSGRIAGRVQRRSRQLQGRTQNSNVSVLHLHYGATYIQQQHERSAANRTAIGTGGTPFMVYLEEHRQTTLLPLRPRRNGSHSSQKRASPTASPSSRYAGQGPKRSRREALSGLRQRYM